jgi:arsenite methyltransferase
MLTLHCLNDGQPLRLIPESHFKCDFCGAIYEILRGIPRFVSHIPDEGQQQVQRGFQYKWTRDEWGFKPEHRTLMRDFFNSRFGFSDDAALASVFRNKTVLHAGIGSGQTEQYYLSEASEVWGIDISESVDACKRNWAKYYPENAHKLQLLQADLMNMPFEDNAFDVVLSDGVFHHTPDTFEALKATSRKVQIGGLVIFYVYRKKAPIREFVDDYIREEVSKLSPEEAWKRLEPITHLARSLSELAVTVNVSREIPLLGIPEGDFDLQRFLYWNVLKLYWNEALSFDENNHVNFDWYYPRYAWRQTPEQVSSWLLRIGLRAIHFNVSQSGISVIAQKECES